MASANSQSQGNQSSSLKKRPTTPLKRISRGSLSQLARSQTRADPTTSPLDVFSSAFSELADNMNDLQTNFEHINAIQDSITGFNEAFASFLYGLKMNAFCVEFPEAPVAESFRRAQIQRERIAETTTTQNFTTSENQPNEFADTTFVTNDVSNLSFQEVIPKKEISKPKKSKSIEKPSKPENKKASSSSNGSTQLKQLQKKILDSLPVKYRDPGPNRTAMETLIKALQEHPEGLKYPDILKLSSVPRNQCTQYMNALVATKFVLKIIENKIVLYRLGDSR